MNEQSATKQDIRDLKKDIRADIRDLKKDNKEFLQAIRNMDKRIDKNTYNIRWATRIGAILIVGVGFIDKLFNWFK